MVQGNYNAVARHADGDGGGVAEPGGEPICIIVDWWRVLGEEGEMWELGEIYK